MISADYCRLLARYNGWQNASLVTAADGLPDAARWQSRGAYFKSIAATLNHLYWADALILARINGNMRPHRTITHSLTQPANWEDFKALRSARDAEIEVWANGLTDEDLHGNVAWYPLDGSGRVEMLKTLCVVQFFNHQTHHRGQVHGMLTAAGAIPDVTDIAAMP
ncbi:MAG: damage-inducible protein DinB [Shimia sp.]|nr:damage-inducible protein DinB [Shimia sp.]